MENNLNTIKNFIKNETFCVISTFGLDGFPNAATMAFSFTEDLEVILSTNKNSRKYKNLLENPKCSITFGWDEKVFTTVQFQGTARMVTDPIELKKVQDIQIAKHPISAQYKDDPDNQYMIIKPVWVRYSDMINGNVFEMSF